MILTGLDTLRSTVTGGALGRKTYTFDHLHFHWGSDDSRGSEHTIQRRAYPAEVSMQASDNAYHIILAHIAAL